jgi:hypothetical protein
LVETHRRIKGITRRIKDDGSLLRIISRTTFQPGLTAVKKESEDSAGNRPLTMILLVPVPGFPATHRMTTEKHFLFIYRPRHGFTVQRITDITDEYLHHGSH